MNTLLTYQTSNNVKTKIIPGLIKVCAKQALLYIDSKNEICYNIFEVNLLLPIKI